MNRFLGFFKDVKNEMYKVVWPSRQDTFRYTVTVIVFSIVVAVILGAADYGLLKAFEAILNK